MLRNRPGLSSTVYCSCSLPDCLKVTRPSTCDQIVLMRPVYLYTLVFHGDSIYLLKSWAPFKWFQYFYVMGKKYAVFTDCFFLFCAIVLKVVKLQVISSCPEQNIFILVSRMFQQISVRLSRLIDRLFTNLLNIHIRPKNCFVALGVQSENFVNLGPCFCFSFYENFWSCSWYFVGF